MNYGAGYTATYYGVYVDPLSWTETERVELTAGSIKRQDKDIRQTADLTVTEFQPDKERWLRVYLDARQGEDITHEALFTGIAATPKKDINGQTVTMPLACYSVLKPCEDIKLQRGYYIPAGENAARALRKLLEVTPAPLDIAEDAPEITEHIIAESGESNLTMIDRVLNAIGWRLYITGDGTVHAGPPPQETAESFSPTGLDIVEKTLTITRDWFNCPNVFRATAGDATATAIDDDPKSPLSTVSRGREIIMAEDSVTLADNEGIVEYAVRRLREEQKTVESADYSRRYIPGLNIGDLVRLDYDEIDGQYRIEEQTINLTYGGQTAERVTRTETSGAVQEITPRRKWALIVLPDGYHFVFPDGTRILVPYTDIIHS